MEGGGLMVWAMTSEADRTEVTILPFHPVHPIHLGEV